MPPCLVIAAMGNSPTVRMAVKAVPKPVSQAGNPVLAWDRELSLYLHGQVGKKLPRGLFMLFEHSGNGILWLLLVPALWFFAAQPQTRVLWGNLFVGLWVDIALVGLLKAVARRPRPEYNLSSDFLLVVSVDKYSFPSGHAARAAFVAAFALTNAGLLGLAPCLLISSWALITAFSRALMGRHFVGDVAAGLLTGVLTTTIVTKGTFSPAIGWLAEARSESLHRDLKELMH